jgi:hypothetical protein
VRTKLDRMGLAILKKLYAGYDDKEASLGGKAAKVSEWIRTFICSKDLLVRRSAFIAYWLSKNIFSELPTQAIKQFIFASTIKIAHMFGYL